MYGSLRRASLVAVLLGVLTAAPTAGQVTTGSIRGFVKSPDGSPVAGARVVAINPETNLQRSAVAQQNGFFNLAGLPPGSYQVRVGMVGYGAQTREIRVTVGSALNLDVQLSPQAVAIDGVTVTADRIVVETATPEVATTERRVNI